MPKPKRLPQPTDIFVGQRVRMARLLMQPSMSQGDLGRKIGVTFQQVQKYEKGANCIGSSRLAQIADVLGKPVSWFFDERKGDRPNGSDIVQELVTTPYGLALAQSYLSIEHNADRHMVADLAARLAARPAVRVEHVRGSRTAIAGGRAARTG